MYCIHCGKETSRKTENDVICKHCGKELIERELTHDETRTFNQSLHTRLTKTRDNFNAGMVGIVLGSTLLIIGLIFFVLSFKTPDDPDTLGKVLKATCFEFWVSLAGLVSGGILFVIGAIRVVLNKFIREKKILRVLEEVQDNSYKHYSNQ